VAEVVASCVCDAGADCRADDGAQLACTPAHVCVETCTTSADCGSGVCEDTFCRPPACGDDSECAGGQQCLGGNCRPAVTAAAVAACVVLPESAAINAGGSKAFRVVAFGSNGGVLAYGALPSEAVTWKAAGIAAAAASTSLDATFTAPASAPAGSGTIGATIGSIACTPAAVIEYMAAPASSVRVVVVSRATDTPVSNAVVVAEDGTSLTTGADGSATFTGLQGAVHDVSVFATGYAYVTILHTAATDILVPLPPAPNPGVFSGTLTPADFDNLSIPTGTLHVFMSAASFGGNLFDLASSGSLQGPGQPVNITIGGMQGEAPLPEGMALGLADTMFGPDGGGQFSIQAVPGGRALWSLGGNLRIQDVLMDYDPNSGSSLTPLLAMAPLIGELESGVTAGVRVTPGEMASLSLESGARPALALDTLLRLHVDAKTAVLPNYVDDAGDTVPLDGALVIGGALDPVEGFTPLGLTWGENKAASMGTTSPNAVTDPFTPGALPQHVLLRLAPRHGGLETAPWAFLTVVASLEGLLEAITPAQPVCVTCSGTTQPQMVLAASVSFSPSSLAYTVGGTPGGETPVDLSRPMLGTTWNGTALSGSPIPVGAAFDAAARNFTPPAPLPGAAFHRLDLGDGAARWFIYFPASLDAPMAAPIALPTPRTGFDDRATGPARIISVSLGYPPPGRQTPITYDEVVKFGDYALDDLTLETDSFSVRELPVQ
jgi:hypothetical protein